MNIYSLMILVRYASDLLITSYSNLSIVVVKGILHDTCFMKDMHPIFQSKYDGDLMDIFHMIDSEYSPTPFLSRVILEDGGDTLLVEITL